MPEFDDDTLNDDHVRFYQPYLTDFLLIPHFLSALISGVIFRISLLSFSCKLLCIVKHYDLNISILEPLFYLWSTLLPSTFSYLFLALSGWFYTFEEIMLKYKNKNVLNLLNIPLHHNFSCQFLFLTYLLISAAFILSTVCLAKIYLNL